MTTSRGRSKRAGNGSARRRRGSATLELAIVLPILMSIALIACDFGRFVHYYIAVTNAARAGAEYGVMNPVTAATLTQWQNNVTAAAQAELESNPWFNAERLTIATPTSVPEGALAMRTVTVTVQYDFRTVVPWPFLSNYNDPHLMSRTIVMRAIR